MLASQQQSASNDGAISQSPVQAEFELPWPHDFDPLFDDTAPDGLGGAGPPENIHGGFVMSDFNHGWPLASNMAREPAYNSPENNFGGSQNQFSGATANNQSSSSGPPLVAATTSLRRESVHESELQVTNLSPSTVRGIELTSPRPEEGETTVQVKCDALVILSFDMQSLSSGSVTYDGLNIPSTPSVNRKGSGAGKKLLFLQIRILGATTKTPYETLCHRCKDKAGNKGAFPDYRARSNILTQQTDGKVPVTFTLACCSKHREPQDSEYCLEVVLNGGPEQNVPFIQYQLPYSFNIVLRHQAEDIDDEHTLLRKSLYSVLVGTPESQGTCPPRPDNISTRASTGPPPSINGDPPVATPIPSRQHHQAVNAARDETAGGRNIVIMNANPRRGTITGGTEIWIWGADFPTDRVPLYARFGYNFSRVVTKSPELLSCILPRANAPGKVPITLTHSPNPNAPVLGVSRCQFEYITDLNEMLPVNFRAQEDCTPEVAAALDILHNEMKKRDLKRNEERPLRGEETQHDEIESALIQALAPLQNTLDFGELISKTDEYKQSLAHFAVLFGYTNLLKRLVGWNIDLTIADVNGFTALHCAYKKGDRICVDLLLENGASETVLDALGRAPSHLMPNGFASLSDNDTDMSSGGQPKLEQRRDASSLFRSAEPTFTHSRCTSPSDINNSSTGIAIRLLEPEGVVFLSRKAHVYLDIGLPLRFWNAIRLPLTESVTIGDSSLLGDHLKPLLLVIIARGATTRQECNRVCRECEEKVGNRPGPLSLIDFHSPSRIITPKRGTIQVDFTFSCYSRHHRRGDKRYVLEVILKDEREPSEPVVVARKELPYTFDVRSSKPQPRTAIISALSRIREIAKYPTPPTTNLARLKEGPHPEGVERQTRRKQKAKKILELPVPQPPIPAPRPPPEAPRSPPKAPRPEVPRPPSATPSITPRPPPEAIRPSPEAPRPQPEAIRPPPEATPRPPPEAPRPRPEIPRPPPEALRPPPEAPRSPPGAPRPRREVPRPPSATPSATPRPPPETIRPPPEAPRPQSATPRPPPEAIRPSPEAPRQKLEAIPPAPEVTPRPAPEAPRPAPAAPELEPRPPQPLPATPLLIPPPRPPVLPDPSFQVPTTDPPLRDSPPPRLPAPLPISRRSLPSPPPSPPPHSPPGTSPPSSRPMSQRILTVLVIGMYDAQEDNEINLVEGEYIYEVDQLDDGWWEGTTEDGKRGMFPASYVEECAPPNRDRVSALPPLPPFPRLAKASRMQKSQQGQKRKMKKGKGGDDDSKFSKAPQPRSNGGGSSAAARNRFLLLEGEDGD